MKYTSGQVMEAALTRLEAQVETECRETDLNAELAERVVPMLQRRILGQARNFQPSKALEAKILQEIDEMAGTILQDLTAGQMKKLQEAILQVESHSQWLQAQNKSRPKPR